MKPEEPLTINININWRVLVVLGVAIGILVAAYSAVGAQNGNPPSTNDRSQQPPLTTAPQTSTLTQNNPFDLHCTDGYLPATISQCVPADSVGKPSSPDNSEVVVPVFPGQKGHYYLTSLNYHTNNVLTACGAGYHMASLWEILDVSHLTYDYNNPAAKTTDDSGFGPPDGWNGWVHTGYLSSGSTTTGQGNCLAWTSTDAANSGVSVELSNAWVTTPGSIGPWIATSFSCNYIGSVWCVGN